MCGRLRVGNGFKAPAQLTPAVPGKNPPVRIEDLPHDALKNGPRASELLKKESGKVRYKELGKRLQC